MTALEPEKTYHRCLRCSHEWHPRVWFEHPKQCPRCKNKHWWTPPGSLKRGRRPKPPVGRDIRKKRKAPLIRDPKPKPPPPPPVKKGWYNV